MVLPGDQSAAPQNSGLAVGEQSLERLRLAASIARVIGLSFLLPGRRFKRADQVLMADFMHLIVRDDFGVGARWLGTNSRSTRENAQYSARLRRAQALDTVILVTHNAHMR